MKRSAVVLFFLVIAIGILATCQEEVIPETTVAITEGVYLNHNDSVGYVGMTTCKTCHAKIHSTFSETGMGMSFGKADTAKSIGSFNGKSVYDATLNMYYQPFWKGDTLLYVKEYRLEKGDTIHKLLQKIDYVVGSGQHTNSHIFSINNHLFQAPFTWYAQKGKLDLPPGYENGGNSRFDRSIGLECMSCHNAMPTGFVEGSYNKFTNVPKGIDCERCHGPGEVHVKRVSAGLLVDTANEIDYSIVNPKKLNTQLQFEVCQRCHLQGNAVLQADKSFFSFKPGMQLSSVMDVYLPRYENDEDQFIMASHADRLKMSKCFKAASGNFNCISCHNPHVSVKNTNLKSFNSTCVGCHTTEKRNFCTEEEALLAAKDNNCVSCHMPPSGSTDIPHVTVHDHYIRKPTEKTKTQKLGAFLGLVAVNNTKPSTRSKIMAYLQQYERFGGELFMLDSASLLLQKYSEPSKVVLQVHLLSLQQKFAEITKLAEKQGVLNLARSHSTKNFENSDAWFHYRIGEAYLKQAKAASAVPYLRKAIALAPYVADFKVKLADAVNVTGGKNEAEKLYREVLTEEPRNRSGLNNLAFILLVKGNYTEAKTHLTILTQQYPDYEQGWMNVAQLALLEQNETALKNALEQAVRINPKNTKAVETLKQMGH